MRVRISAFTASMSAASSPASRSSGFATFSLIPMAHPFARSHCHAVDSFATAP